MRRARRSPPASQCSKTPTAPISRWEIVRAFPTEKECDAHRHFGIPPGVPPEVPPRARCISAHHLAHAKALHAPSWLLMKAPHDDVTAPLAQWTSIKEEGFNVIFPNEESCDDYRARLYRGTAGRVQLPTRPASRPRYASGRMKNLWSRVVSRTTPRASRKNSAPFSFTR